MDEVIAALRTLRAPIQQDEYDLHRLVADCLTAAGLHPAHEVRLAPHCRIDFLCGSVGVEIKRGKPERARLIRQLSRYGTCEQVEALVVVAERTVDLPRTILGKPLKLVCLNRLWGIAL